MKQILCFGDSNTHGYNAATGGRFDANTRWTGRLAAAMAGETIIFEGGLNGRTCNYSDPEKPYRKGLDYLGYELIRNKPLDAVVIMLGVNDCKTCYNAAPEDITAQLERLIRRVQAFAAMMEQEIRILVMGCVPLDERGASGRFDLTSVEKSRALPPLYQAAAERCGVAYADAGQWDIPLDFDGTHFTAVGHRRFARRMEQTLRSLLEMPE